jgi:hypothetical protein
VPAPDHASVAHHGIQFKGTTHIHFFFIIVLVFRQCYPTVIFIIKTAWHGVAASAISAASAVLFLVDVHGLIPKAFLKHLLDLGGSVVLLVHADLSCNNKYVKVFFLNLNLNLLREGQTVVTPIKILTPRL